ncbi:MAG: tetratricopeptide repeat protein [Chitinivibrionales bacterium]|nr:tetratricopeptide repeat protein [Chitinivibrionales bacterium]MBD3397256.1 tetratricopeptide repeat protein [Chitinivibrionales bacterium]
MTNSRNSNRLSTHAGIALLLVCIHGFGCAFLNTFYNARTAYRTARREHTRLLRTSPDSAAELPPEITDQYERAIVKSAKVLEVYPKQKKWHDDALFLMGRAAFYKGEMPHAIRRFRRLQREFPASPYIPESYLYLGKAYLGNDNLVKADETFQFVMEHYPELNDNEEVTLLMAQVAIKREGKAQAIALLENTLASVRTPEKKMEILLQIARLYMDLGRFEKATSVLESAPRRKKSPELLFQIDFALLSCHGALRKDTKALALADRMLKNRQYVSHYLEIRLKKGRILVKAGRIDEAVDVFEQITRGTTSPGLRGEAWYELGRIYQHERGDFAKARECYEQAASLATDEEIRETAQTRVRAIDEMDSYRLFLADRMAEKDTTDTTDTASTVTIDTTASPNLTRYKMGEIFWLHLDEPDSALQYFSAITADTAAKDSLQTQALYARAWITLNMKKDTLGADSMFARIIKENPASMFAKKSQQELGIPVTVRTREDSARFAYIEAENRYHEDGDALAATKAYLKVARAYPDMDVAPRSMYAAAWLCDNVLHKNVTARRLYQALCDSFPGSDLCQKEAKPRLQIVEDTLEVLKARRQEEETKPGARPATATANDDPQASGETDRAGEDEADAMLEDGPPADDDAAGKGADAKQAEGRENESSGAVSPASQPGITTRKKSRMPRSRRGGGAAEAQQKKSAGAESPEPETQPSTQDR